MAGKKTSCTRYFIQTESISVKNEDGPVSVEGGTVWQQQKDNLNLHLINRNISDDKGMAFLTTGIGLKRNEVLEFDLKFKEIDEKTFNLLLAIPDLNIRLYFHSNGERLRKGLSIKEGTRVVYFSSPPTKTPESLDEYYSGQYAKDSNEGTVKYIGGTTNFRGSMFGVELDEVGEGTCNGWFSKHQYFTCADDTAVFCAAHQLLPLSEPEDNPFQQNLNYSDQRNVVLEKQSVGEKDLQDMLEKSFSSNASLSECSSLSNSDVDHQVLDQPQSGKNTDQSNLNFSQPHSSSYLLKQSPVPSNSGQSDQIKGQSKESFPNFHKNIISSSDPSTAVSKADVKKSAHNPRALSSQSPDSYSQGDLQFPGQISEGQGQVASSSLGESSEQLKLGERIVVLETMACGTVRWIGHLPGSINNSDSTLRAGIEFDNPVGKGNGKYRKTQLFDTEKGHAGIVPIVGLLRERDFVFQSS